MGLVLSFIVFPPIKTQDTLQYMRFGVKNVTVLGSKNWDIVIVKF